jgi:hypothetical protein
MTTLNDRRLPLTLELCPVNTTSCDIVQTIIRGRTGFGKSWKVLEIDNGFFQDLESFGKLIFGPLGYGKVMDFFVACLAYTLQRIVFVVKRRRFFVSTVRVSLPAALCAISSTIRNHQCVLQYCFALVNVC